MQQTLELPIGSVFLSVCATEMMRPTFWRRLDKIKLNYVSNRPPSKSSSRMRRCFHYIVGGPSLLDGCQTERWQPHINIIKLVSTNKEGNHSPVGVKQKIITFMIRKQRGMLFCRSLTWDIVVIETWHPYWASILPIQFYKTDDCDGCKVQMTLRDLEAGAYYWPLRSLRHHNRSSPPHRGGPLLRNYASLVPPLHFPHWRP